MEVSGPPPPQRKAINRESLDISFILDEGILRSGIKKPRYVKALQEALLVLGLSLIHI